MRSIAKTVTNEGQKKYWTHCRQMDVQTHGQGFLFVNWGADFLKPKDRFCAYANKQDHTSSNYQVQISFVCSSILALFGSKPCQAIVMTNEARLYSKVQDTENIISLISFWEQPQVAPLCGFCLRIWMMLLPCWGVRSRGGFMLQWVPGNEFIVASSSSIGKP